MDQINLRMSFVLEDEVVAVSGAHAAIDISTGTVKPLAGGDVNLVAIGRFTEDLTGDGTARVGVEFYAPRHLARFSASATGTPTAADVGKFAYAANDGVTVTAGTNARVGMIFGLTPGGLVLVDPSLFAITVEQFPEAP